MSMTAIVVACLLWPASSGATVFDRIVAIVNDDIVTLSEMDEAAKPVLKRLFVSQHEGTDLTGKAREVKLQILNMLVDKKLAEQEVKRLGISVSREDIDRVIEDVKRESRISEDELRQALAQEGTGWTQYREQISEQLCRARLINEEVRAKIVITEDRCRDYYNAHQSDYTVSDEVAVSHILFAVPPDASAEEKARQERLARKALKNLKADADFATVAKRYSEEASTAAEGGSLGWLRVDDMVGYLKDALNRLQPGQVTDVVSTEQGLQIFRLDGFRKGGLKPLAEARDEIYRKLYQQEVDTAYEEWLATLRKRAFIKLTF
ncbi:MAG: peptidylprolyl isomerase [Pseudomonadota bacterium]